MKQIAIIFAILLIIPAVSMAVENDGYVVNVMAGGEFVKEIDGTAYVVFDSEYKLLLKNNTDKTCSARVFIDGARVSPGGDFVIHARDELLLERFVADLDSGKRFKFVPLSNSAVDDPTRKENGIVRVEFRKIKIDDSQTIIFDDDWGQTWIPVSGSLTDLVMDSNDTTDTIPTSSDIDTETLSTLTSGTVTNASNGATIAGSESTQQFHKVDYDFEESFVEVTLEMRGIGNEIDGQILLYNGTTGMHWVTPMPLDQRLFNDGYNALKELATYSTKEEAMLHCKIGAVNVCIECPKDKEIWICK